MATTKRRSDPSNDTPSLDRSAREGEHNQGFRAVGVAASKLAAPIVARRGGGVLVRLKSEWPAIIGTDYAAVTWPSALGRDGVLKLRASSTAALDLQHRTSLLIERINLFFGRVRPLAPGGIDFVDERLSEIADPQLRNALARLGRAVAGARG